MPFSTGDRLGPYEVLAPIGSGGMGEVWKARDTRLDRIVAIKLLKSAHSARFEQEARAIAALNHPHICQIHDVGSDYLVLEFVDGKPLEGPMNLEQALPLAQQITSALEAAHKRGILHRDLKPANVIVTENGAKLLDFGLAKLAEGADPAATKTMEGTVMGTAPYMSPEQAQGKAADARSDIFSFGAVLYEVLSGRRAFNGNSILETLNAVVRDEPETLDSPLASVVKKCLAKDASQRFQSAAELKAAFAQFSTHKERVSKQPSIAVLPFVNMSADKENEYFSDGLAEEILNLLTKIPGLKVIARTSSFSFRGKEQDIRRIAETLGVSHVLEGSVRRSANRLRVTAQLIHAADGAHIWSERYDRDMTDVFAIQDEIGQAISEALQVRLAPRTQAVNVEAYQWYLKGQYHRAHLTPESLAKAKECFERALAIDPNYALAHGGVANYYHTLAAAGIKSFAEVALAAKAAAQKALALDSANGEAHTVLGVFAGVDYSWVLAEQHFSKALAVEPVAPLSRFRYASFYLLRRGQFADAKEQCRLALEADPVSMILHFGMAWSMYHARQYGEAIEYARKALEIDRDFYFVWLAMGFAQLGERQTEEAIRSFKRLVELAPWFDWGAALAGAYHQAGDQESGRECMRGLPASTQNSEALYYAMAHEREAMFDAFERALQRRELVYAHLPLFDPYRSDPRFQALLQRMNLT